jgi:hypothetical protein
MVPLLLACAAARLLATQPGVTKPTKPILDWQLNDTGCFVHYNMATMAGLQGCQDGVTAPPPISAWQPTALDTDAWVSTCKAMGGTRMIYVAKHGCGFAAWKSEVAYNYSVANAPDQTDVVAAFVESARRGGIGVGFYYSDATNSYCRVRGGVVVPGATQPGRQITVTQAQYDNVVLAHLAELWGNCDAAPPPPPSRSVTSQRLLTPRCCRWALGRAVVRRWLLSTPQAAAQGAHREAAAERGGTRWVRARGTLCTLGWDRGRASALPLLVPHQLHLERASQMHREKWPARGGRGQRRRGILVPRRNGFHAAEQRSVGECSRRVRPRPLAPATLLICVARRTSPMQFYNGKIGVHTPAELRHMYEQSAGSNNALIIDIAPFPNGSVPAAQVAAAAALGRFKKGCYGGTPVASGSGSGSAPITIKPSTAGGLGSNVGAMIDRVQICEDISQGQIVRRFTLSAQLGNGSRVPLCPQRGGSSIGSKYICVLPAPLRVTSLAMAVTAAEGGTPRITQFAAFSCDSLAAEIDRGWVATRHT